MAKRSASDSEKNIQKTAPVLSEQFSENSDDLLCPVDDNCEQFVECFKSVADNWLEKNINKYVPTEKSDFFLAQYNEQLRISDRMEALLAKISDYDDIEDQLPKQYADIIKGIKETVDIKREGLKEDVLDFKKTCENINDIIKRKADFEKRLSDLILSFKRDVILFEISTFEEMINHSVLLLERSDIQSVKAFADLVKDAYEEILTEIKSTGIEVIEPKPYEMFNSRENEVLIAEENGDFDKGQIIKTVLCGYRQGETVILRANVIAAK